MAHITLENATNATNGTNGKNSTKTTNGTNGTSGLTSSFLEDCQRGSRINELADWFDTVARGLSQQPTEIPRADRRLLANDDPWRSRFIDLFPAREGPFTPHYHASIPYRIEETCRIGPAILNYSLKRSEPLLCRCVAAADATMSRTTSELAGGRVKWLCCSPNAADKENFMAFGKPEHAFFFHGPFFHLTNDVINSREDLAIFASGFDIVYEETTFQMYSPNRTEQIAFLAQFLKPDGIFFCVEKYRHTDLEEYKRRELQKDHGFKARYFSGSDLVSKGNDILTTMSGNMVTLDDMAIAMKKSFSHCYVTWNSGNFYTLMASNDRENLDLFVAGLGEPAIPREYSYESTLPRLLF